ncbi:MAG: GIY-YIG nuclease family protein [Candidatus Levybacteria bacterium]|nr:GIY-YIG nuclease family protein [Candidatus Levybacteria bacterium]
MNFFVYVIENENGQWYIGQTNNWQLRVKKHNSQKVKSTKNRGVWNIIYKLGFKTRSEAMRHEEYLKSGAGRKYLKELLDRK